MTLGVLQKQQTVPMATCQSEGTLSALQHDYNPPHQRNLETPKYCGASLVSFWGYKYGHVCYLDLASFQAHTEVQSFKAAYNQKV